MIYPVILSADDKLLRVFPALDSMDQAIDFANAFDLKNEGLKLEDMTDMCLVSNEGLTAMYCGHWTLMDPDDVPISVELMNLFFGETDAVFAWAVAWCQWG